MGLIALMHHFNDFVVGYWLILSEKTKKRPYLPFSTALLRTREKAGDYARIINFGKNHLDVGGTSTVLGIGSPNIFDAACNRLVLLS